MEEIDSKIFLNSLEEDADYLVFERGVKYYEDGKVYSVKVSEIREPDYVRITSSVKGSFTYKTTIGIKNSFLADYECSCPYSLDHGPCKHAVALGHVVAYSTEPVNVSQPSMFPSLNNSPHVPENTQKVEIT